MSRDPRYQKLLNSKRWQEVKAIVWKRANGLCERCREEGFIRAGVDCHHVIPVESAHTIQEMEALCFNEAPEQRLEALCIPCHIKAHAEERSHSKQAHKQREDDRLERWKQRQGNRRE